MESVDLWIQLGVAGLILFGFITDKITTGTQLLKAEARAEKAEAQRDQVRDDIANQFVPVVQRAITVFEQREDLDKQTVDVLEDVRRLLEARS